MRKERAKVGLGFDDEMLKTAPLKSGFVLKLMTYNFAYDIQCEGDRAWYAYRFFKFTKHKEKIVRKFHDYLMNLPEESYGGHKDHVFEVAARLWESGYLKRKDIFKAILHHHNHDENNWISLNALLKLGKKGIKLYVNEMGKSHAVEKFYDYYPYEKKNTRLLKLLKNKGIKRNDLTKDGAEFLKDLKGWKREVRSSKPRFSSFEDYLRFISGNRFRGRATKFFQSFNPEQVEILIGRLKKTVNADVQYGLMAPLNELDISVAPSLFLRLTDSEDRQVRRAATRILAKVKSGKVRRKALQMIKSSVHLSRGIEMLSSNVEVGDDELIRSRLEKLSSKIDLHDCGYSLISAAKFGAPILLADSLRFIYHNSRCSICRQVILKQLDEGGLIPMSEFAAARYDASAEVRSYAQSRC